MIDKFATIECDNGKSYRVLPNWHGAFYNRIICLDNEIVNEVHEEYLNTCLEYDDPICIGMKNGNLEYTKILKVYDLHGRQIK